jgi:predicted SAM-dependent methyltransferase
MLEHLYPDEAISLIGEIYRVLQPNGLARLVMPGFDHAIRICSGAAESRWPRHFDSPSAQAINYLFCDGQHHYAYSYELMKQVAEKAGFSKIERSAANEFEYQGEMPVEPVGSLAVHLVKQSLASDLCHDRPDKKHRRQFV